MYLLKAITMVSRQKKGISRVTKHCVYLLQMKGNTPICTVKRNINNT